MLLLHQMPFQGPPASIDNHIGSISSQATQGTYTLSVIRCGHGHSSSAPRPHGYLKSKRCTELQDEHDQHKESDATTDYDQHCFARWTARREVVVNIAAVYRVRIGAIRNDLSRPLIGQNHRSFNRNQDAKKPIGRSEDDAINQMHEQTTNGAVIPIFAPKKPAPANGMNATIMMNQANTLKIIPFSQ